MQYAACSLVPPVPSFNLRLRATGRSAVIDFDLSARSDFVTIRFRGIVANDQIERAAIRVVNTLGGGPPVRVFFDWSDVQQWPCEPLSPGVHALCMRAASCVERSAIVHSHRLYRQAAWLAAMLRLKRATVRSWRAADVDAAVIWVCEPRSPRIVRSSWPA